MNSASAFILQIQSSFSPLRIKMGLTAARFVDTPRLQAVDGRLDNFDITGLQLSKAL